MLRYRKHALMVALEEERPRLAFAAVERTAGDARQFLVAVNDDAIAQRR